MTQKFSYHTHTNALGIFDGKHSAKEMIQRAEELGYEELGISNHLICHPNLQITSPMFFNDFDLLKKMMQKNIDDIRLAAEKASLRVYVGFEVDFFPSAKWRNAFEKLMKFLNADYYIGSFHCLRNADESRVYNMYHYQKSGSPLSSTEIADAIHNYWQNISMAAESGYFDFIAHLDVYKIFPDWAALGTKEDKLSLVETLGRVRLPYELNTSGWSKCGEQHPYEWMLKALKDKDVPIVISDDAHDVSHLARHFERAEDLLKKLNYTNRWRLKR